MSQKIYAIKHDVRRKLWCGPAALAAVTGETTSRIYAVTDRVLGRKTRSMGVRHILTAARDLGYEPMWHRVLPQTFAQFRKQRTPEQRRRALSVFVTSHYVVLIGNRFVDNYHTDPILATQYARQRKRVRGYFTVEERA